MKEEWLLELGFIKTDKNVFKKGTVVITIGIKRLYIDKDNIFKSASILPTSKKEFLNDLKRAIE